MRAGKGGRRARSRQEGDTLSRRSRATRARTDDGLVPRLRSDLGQGDLEDEARRGERKYQIKQKHILLFYSIYIWLALFPRFLIFISDGVWTIIPSCEKVRSWRYVANLLVEGGRRASVLAHEHIEGSLMP